MRGVKYSIDFQTLDNRLLNFDNKTMSECIALVIELCKEHYNIDMKITKHIIYNLVHRTNCNKLLKRICKIKIMDKS